LSSKSADEETGKIRFRNSLILSFNRSETTQSTQYSDNFIRDKIAEINLHAKTKQSKEIGFHLFQK
jgi:hypothetical protein